MKKKIIIIKSVDKSVVEVSKKKKMSRQKKIVKKNVKAKKNCKKKSPTKKKLKKFQLFSFNKLSKEWSFNAFSITF